MGGVKSCKKRTPNKAGGAQPRRAHPLFVNNKKRKQWVSPEGCLRNQVTGGEFLNSR